VFYAGVLCKKNQPPISLTRRVHTFPVYITDLAPAQRIRFDDRSVFALRLPQSLAHSIDAYKKPTAIFFFAKIGTMNEIG